MATSTLLRTIHRPICARRSIQFRASRRDHTRQNHERLSVDQTSHHNEYVPANNFDFFKKLEQKTNPKVEAEFLRHLIIRRQDSGLTTFDLETKVRTLSKNAANSETGRLRETNSAAITPEARAKIIHLRDKVKQDEERLRGIIDDERIEAIRRRIRISTDRIEIYLGHAIYAGQCLDKSLASDNSEEAWMWLALACIHIHLGRQSITSEDDFIQALTALKPESFSNLEHLKKHATRLMYERYQILRTHSNPVSNRPEPFHFYDGDPVLPLNSRIGQQNFSVFGNEIGILFLKALQKWISNPDETKFITMKELFDQYKFSKESVEVIKGHYIVFEILLDVIHHQFYPDLDLATKPEKPKLDESVLTKIHERIESDIENNKKRINIRTHLAAAARHLDDGNINNAKQSLRNAINKAELESAYALAQLIETLLSQL